MNRFFLVVAAGLAAVLAASPRATAAVDVPTTERRALDETDLASSSGLALPTDAVSTPLADTEYLRAFRALRSVGLVDPFGERIDGLALAREDGRLHLEFLIPSVELRAYAFGGADEHLLEHRGGDTLSRGFNTFLSAGGSAAWGKHVGGAYEVRLGQHPGDWDLAAKRLFLEGTLGKWTFKVGRDTVRLGPGYHGSLLLDDNGPPLDLWQLRTDAPLFLPGFLSALGGFRFNVFNAYLSDSSPSTPDARYGSGTDAVANPNLLGMRFSYHPASWLDLGLSRTILYGGDGRESYDTPGDWWQLFAGTNENVHEGESDRYDNDQYAALDLTVRLPFLNGLGPLKGGKIYWEYAGTDLIANWKSGEGTGNWEPANFDDIANLGGLYLSTAVTDLRVEYAQTSPAWYRHHQYSQGYSYRGLPLGHAMGGDARDIFVRLSRYLGPEWRLSAALDREDRGRSLPEQEKRWECQLGLEGYRLQAFGIPFTARVDALGARVRNPLDDPGTDRRSEWYLGVGVQVVP